MKILPINTINSQIISRENTNIKTNTNNIEGSNTTSLLTPNAFYNLITFKSKNIQQKTMPELINYMEGTVKPFLDKTKELSERGYSILDQIDNAISNFKPQEIKFNPLEQEGVKEEIERLRIGELHKNREGFYTIYDSYEANKDDALSLDLNGYSEATAYYLWDRYQSYCPTEETEDFATEIKPKFSVPSFLKKVYKEFETMQSTCENINDFITIKSLLNQLEMKKKQIRNKIEDVYSGLMPRGKVERAYNSFNKLQELNVPADIYIAKYREAVESAENGINEYNKEESKMQPAIEKAEKLYKSGLFSKKDEKTLERIKERSLRRVNLSIEKFKRIASKTQLDTKQSEQLDKILNEQSTLLNALKEKNEKDTQAYLSSEAAYCPQISKKETKTDKTKQ